MPGNHPGLSYEDCDKLCCSDFICLEDPDEGLDPRAGSWSFNLTNPLLSLFVPEKFVSIVPRPDGDPGPDRYENITPALYDKLKPTLRLASRMLTDDRAVHFIYTMSKGTLHKGIDAGSPALTWPQIDADEPAYDQVTHPTAPQTHLTRVTPQTLSAQEARVHSRAVLEDLAGVLNLIQLDYKTTFPGTTSFLKGPWRFAPVEQAAQDKFPRGLPAQIILSASAAGLDKDVQTPWQQYKTACIIVHEVGHLVNKEIHGYRQHEVFYGFDAATSETGYELEAAMFGGVLRDNAMNVALMPPLNGSVPNPKWVQVQHTWPSPKIFYEYEGEPYDFARRMNASNRVSADPSHFSIDYDTELNYLRLSRLHHSFLAEVCSDSFWDERSRSSQSSTQLNPSKISPRYQGYCVLELTFVPEEINPPVAAYWNQWPLNPDYPHMLTEVRNELARIYREKQRRIAEQNRA